MSIRNNYKHTLTAGYISFITQAIINNFTPLLFVTFQKDWGITLGQLATLSTYNFMIQLLADLVSARYIDKIGVRRAIVFAHISSALGLAGLGTFPFITADPYHGLFIAITLYAIGGGLIEVLGSPIIEACPTKNKEAHMSLLHSFYCWGQMLAVLGSTLFFHLFSTGSWRIMAFVWALIPALNSFYFSCVPIYVAPQTDKNDRKLSELLKNKTFYILMVMMLCAGSSELAVSQWASAFAEESLKITKTAGDLLGPCMFALLMGIARVAYTKLSRIVVLEKYILFCAVLCLAGYLIISLAPHPALSLIGCGICGYAVGIMWPGTYSIAAKTWKNPSASMFAFFALAGDMGCSAGPLLVGNVSQAFDNNLKAGLFAGSALPLVMIIAVSVLIADNRKKQRKEHPEC